MTSEKVELNRILQTAVNDFFSSPSSKSSERLNEVIAMVEEKNLGLTLNAKTESFGGKSNLDKCNIQYEEAYDPTYRMTIMVIHFPPIQQQIKDGHDPFILHSYRDPYESWGTLVIYQQNREKMDSRFVSDHRHIDEFRSFDIKWLQVE